MPGSDLHQRRRGTGGQRVQDVLEGEVIRGVVGLGIEEGVEASPGRGQRHAVHHGAAVAAAHPGGALEEAGDQT